MIIHLCPWKWCPKEKPISAQQIIISGFRHIQTDVLWKQKLFTSRLGFGVIIPCNSPNPESHAESCHSNGWISHWNSPTRAAHDTPRHWWLHQWCVPFQTKATCPRLSGCIIQRHLHLLAGWTPSKISKLPLKPTNTYYKLMKAMGVYTYRTDGLLYSTFACWIPMFINFQRFISRIPSDKNQVVEDSVFFGTVSYMYFPNQSWDSPKSHVGCLLSNVRNEIDWIRFFNKTFFAHEIPMRKERDLSLEQAAMFAA